MSGSSNLLSLTLAWLIGAGVGAGLLACERSRDVAVRVSIPGPDSMETPVTGIGLVALPYDRDSVLKALESRAKTARPATAELDTLFQAFRQPFTNYSAVTFRVGRLQDSVTELKGRLDSMPRKAAEYSQLYARFSRLTDSLTAARRQAEQAKAELDRARGQFVTRSDSLRTLIRHWEDSTYAGYDSIVRNLAMRRHRDPVTDTTGADGWARFHLQSGQWWIYGRSWDATDPNAEWYWNVPVAGDTVLLSSRTGRRQPRY